MKRGMVATAALLSAMGMGIAGSAAAQLPTPPPPELHRVIVENASGLDDPPTIVVLHGGPGQPHGYLRPEWDRLRESGRVVYYDQRGCGDSAGGPVGWRTHVWDLDRLISTVAPGGNVVLAGTSWGSVLALLYAHRYPERLDALILTGVPSWSFLIPEPGEAQVQVSPDLKPRTLPALVEAEPPADMDPHFYGVDEAFRQRLRNRCPLASFVTLHSVRSRLTRPPLSEFSQVEVPVLVLVGEGRGDFPEGGPELSRILPRSREVTIPDAGHAAWYNDPDRFFTEANAFLAGLREEDSGTAVH